MAPLDMMNQLCKVCGEPAAGYHFGAFTCEGCKSFFGRTYNNLAALGECKNSGQCVINKKNRTSCKSCRLKKCLLVGMSKSGSRYGRRSNWFKIHCLIQDQAEMNSRLADQGVLGNGQHPYDTKDMVHHFRPEFSDAAMPSVNGNSSRGSPSSDPGAMDTSSPLSYSLYTPKNGYSNGYSAFDTTSPSYEKKENMGYHHHHHHHHHQQQQQQQHSHHPHLPLSPVSPLHPSKFFFHPSTNGHFFTKSFAPLPRIFSGDLSYSPPQRLLQVAPNGSGVGTLLRPSSVGTTPSSDCYADVPEQDGPIDLSMKKPETPNSDATLIDDPDDGEYVDMADGGDVDGEHCSKVRAETPLDLTAKKTVNC